MCGLIRRPELEGPDLGFAFLPEFTGMGYAHEIAEATLLHAHDVLKLSRVVAITAPTNQASINVLKKLGFAFKKTFSFPNKAEELMLFST